LQLAWQSPSKDCILGSLGCLFNICIEAETKLSCISQDYNIQYLVGQRFFLQIYEIWQYGLIWNDRRPVSFTFSKNESQGKQLLFQLGCALSI
jgi:hypothetical protein